MKIILVHNRYREAGGEDVVFESEKRLLQRAGHDVVTYERSNSELNDRSPFDRLSIASRMVWSWESRNRFASLLDEVRPEIVHVHNTFMVISPSIYSACSRRKIPVVQTLHNFRLLCPAGTLFRNGEICNDCTNQTLLQSLRHGCYRHSRTATAGVAAMLAFHRTLGTWSTHVSCFIALTQFARQKFIDCGFPSEKVVVKPNFADPDPIARSGPGDCAVYIGRLTQDKGLPVLLKAWALLPEPYPLNIIGDGPERQPLEIIVRELNLSGVTFKGWLPRSEVVQTLKSARFSVVPSLWYEGFPMCIVEAFACGVPVLCSRLGGPKEIVQDRVTGLHFNPGDARDLAAKVEWAWNHQAELLAMGHSARSVYEREFTAETNYSILLSIYEKASASLNFRNVPSCPIPLQSSTR